MKLIRNLCFLLMLPILSHADNSQREISHFACTEKNYQASDDGGYYLVTLSVNKQSLLQPEGYPELSPEEGFASGRVSKHFNKGLICKLTDSGLIHQNKKLSKLNPLIEEEQIETFNPKINLTVRDYSWENLNTKVEELKLTHPTLQASLNEAEYNFSNTTINASASSFSQFNQNYFIPNASAYTKADKLLLLIASAGTLLLLSDYHDAATLTSLAVVGVTGGALKVLPFLTAQAGFTAMLNYQALTTLWQRIMIDEAYFQHTTYNDETRQFTLPQPITDVSQMGEFKVEFQDGLDYLASHYDDFKITYDKIIEDFKNNFLSEHVDHIQKGQWDEIRQDFTHRYDPLREKWRKRMPAEKDRESVFDFPLTVPSITMSLIIKLAVKAPAFSVATANLAQHGVNTALDYYFGKSWEHAVIPYCVYDDRRPWDYPDNLCSACKSFSCRYGLPGFVTVLALKAVFMSKIKID